MKPKTIIINVLIVAIGIIILLIILSITVDLFGNRDAVLNFFNQLADFIASNPILSYINLVVLICAGIILIFFRHNIKTYPFIIIAWIYPILRIIYYLTIMEFPPTNYDDLINLIPVEYINFVPAIVITILGIKFRKKQIKGQISIRAPKPTITFPIERELIFISYATVDSDFFQIPRLTRILTSYPEIDEILYWESDMHDDIYMYMDTNLKRCKVVLLFCTKNSLYSEAVKMEWTSALKLNKKILPVFIEPDDIPALLTTKLGVQFKESDPYSSIEDIYKIILNKLGIESVREFTRYIIPKWITEKDFKELNIEIVEETLSFDSDIPSIELGIQIGSILQNNNFYVPGLKKALKKRKSKKKDTSEFESESRFTQFTSFAELRDNPEDIAILIKIQNITDTNSKVFITVKGKRDWVLREILKDIDLKLIELKSKTELIRNYSGKIISLMEGINDVERFLRRHLGSSVKHIEEIIKQYKNKEINEEEFIIKGTQLIGKDFITVFLRNISLILKEKKKMLDKKPLDQAQIAF